MTTLKLGGLGVTDEGLEKLDTLTRLEFLQLHGAPSVSDAGVHRLLAQHPTLTWLDISGGERTANCLAEGKRLKDVWLSGDQLTAAAVPVIRELSNLESLCVFTPQPVAIRNLSSIPKIRKLTLMSFGTADALRSEDCRELARHPGLETVLIQGNPLTDNGLVELTKLPRLKKLEARSPTPAGIETFRQLRPDVELEIDGKTYPPKSK